MDNTLDEQRQSPRFKREKYRRRFRHITEGYELRKLVIEILVENECGSEDDHEYKRDMDFGSNPFIHDSYTRSSEFLKAQLEGWKTCTYFMGQKVHEWQPGKGGQESIFRAELLHATELFLDALEQELDEGEAGGFAFVKEVNDENQQPSKLREVMIFIRKNLKKITSE